MVRSTTCTSAPGPREQAASPEPTGCPRRRIRGSRSTGAFGRWRRSGRGRRPGTPPRRRSLGRNAMSSTAKPFADRRQAGRALAARLAESAGPDVVVLGLPRGGVVVAAEVARVIGGTLDIVVVRKVGVPWQPELAMGAIAAVDEDV